jgi:hypothetical protein
MLAVFITVAAEDEEQAWQAALRRAGQEDPLWPRGISRREELDALAATSSPGAILEWEEY